MASGIRYSIQVKKGIKKWGVAWAKSCTAICKPEFMGDVAKGYRYYISKYIPKDTGTLRESGHPVYKVGGERKAGGNGTGSATIYWGDRGPSQIYAHYQFIGDVYGPNKAVFNGDTHVGWRSPTAHGPHTKRNMGWKMGEPGSYTLKDGRTVYIKGYTTPGTKYSWTKEFHDDKGDFGETAVNIRAGRYLYEAFCIKSHIKPRGGHHIYNSWNQIKNRIP